VIRSEEVMLAAASAGFIEQRDYSGARAGVVIVTAERRAERRRAVQRIAEVIRACGFIFVDDGF
jgi:hypothetical protein